jgi:DNA-binding NtrC family response regulator
LRVLEDGELERLGSSRTQRVDVRLISATNADLAAEVAQGRFRKDLLFRLNTVELRLPPLRDRQQDIAPMAQAFLARFARRYQRDDLGFSPSALRALEQYPWPGNVRELSHVVERAVLMAGAGRIEQFDFSLQALSSPAALPANDVAAATNMTLEQVEQSMVRNALEQSGGNIQRAAEMLGLSRAALYRRLEKFGIGGE